MKRLSKLAKLDFNIVQSIHQEEMKNVTSWFRDSGLPLFTFARERPLEFYFLIAAGTYEPQYAKCRFLFTKVACLQTVLDDMYDTYGTLSELKLFTEAVRRWDLSFTENLPDYMKLCYKIYYDIVHEVAWEAEKEQGRAGRDETRVTMVIFKDGDGFGISKLEVKDHIKECLIEPLPL